MHTTLAQCPKCHKKNRLIEQPRVASYRCGSCHEPLANPFCYFFFDCETTGLPKSKNTPFLVQLAWEIYDADKRLLGRKDYLVRPDGYTIPRSSTSVHGITHDQALASGVPLQYAIAQLLADTNRPAIRMVAHNLQFDARIIGVEAQRAGLRFSFDGRFVYCTMINTVKVCRIPKRGGGHKWPSLLELHQHLFGSRFNEAHNARCDVRATADCFFELRKHDLLKFDD